MTEMDRSLLPNATQFPDVLTDQLMSLVTGDEWKVIHYGVRYALGHKSADTLTVAQIAHGRQAADGTWVDHGTGLDENAVKACLEFLCDKVHLFLREDKPRRPLGYRLNTDLSSITWDVLEERAHPAPPPTVEPVEPEPAIVPVAPVQPRARRARTAVPSTLVELPSTDVVLAGVDRAVVDWLRDKLAAEERETFDHLLALAQEKAQVGQSDQEVWQVFRLWRTYGLRRMQNALQSPQPLKGLNDVNLSCLVGVLAEMLEAEHFGVITPNFREQIVAMAEEWPDLNEWQQAISIAVRINKRRLSTVKTILSKKTEAPAQPREGETQHGSAPVTGKGRRRPARRQSEWNEADLRAAREAERDEEWSPPPE